MKWLTCSHLVSRSKSSDYIQDFLLSDLESRCSCFFCYKISSMPHCMVLKKCHWSISQQLSYSYPASQIYGSLNIPKGCFLLPRLLCDLILHRYTSSFPEHNLSVLGAGTTLIALNSLLKVVHTGSWWASDLHPSLNEQQGLWMKVFVWCVVRPTGRLVGCQTHGTGMEEGMDLALQRESTTQTCFLGTAADPFPQLCGPLGLSLRSHSVCL